MVLVRDERPWGGLAPPAVGYVYSPDRKSEHALLEGCHGFLHADGYAGFNGLYEPDARSGDARLVEVACWAHCRRKLFEVHAATGSAIAQEALERMAALFKIEAEINGHAPEHRHAVRQDRSLPLLARPERLSHRRLPQHQPQELARRRAPLQPSRAGPPSANLRTTADWK